MRPRLVAVLLAAALLSGCTASDLAGQRRPLCGPEGVRTTFLMSQSVPDAALIPCIMQDPPAPWWLESLSIDSTGTRLSFVEDMTTAAPSRVDLRFSASCDVTGAVAVPSDEADARRLERVERIAAGYVGERHYVFDHGCVTYRFDVHGDGWSGVVHTVSQTWTFMPRAEVQRLRDELRRWPPTPAPLARDRR